MTYQAMKWSLFVALFLLAPALYFFVMAVFFAPAIFMLAGLVYVLWKLVTFSNFSENLTFLAFLGVHLLVVSGLYYLLSVLIAKLIALITSKAARNTAFASVCLALVVMTQLPVYGSGGHGPMNWQTLFQIFAVINRDYGAFTVVSVYGAAALLIATVVLVKRHRREKPSPGRKPPSQDPPGQP